MLSAGALLQHPELVEIAQRARREDHRSHRSAAGARRGRRRGRGHDPLGQDDQPQAAPGSGRRTRPRASGRGGGRGDRADRWSSPDRPARRREGFPANLNIAAALALAGIGPERTQVEVWADPTVTRNTHHDRGRVRRGGLHADDRERPIGEPSHRPDHRAVGRSGCCASGARRCRWDREHRLRGQDRARRRRAAAGWARAIARALAAEGREVVAVGRTLENARADRRT